MKKKISSLIISFAMILSCLFMFTSCGKKKDPTPPAVTVTGVSVELVTEDYEMTNSTITFDYGVKVELEVSDFKVTAQKSDNTSVELSQKTETVDGFTFASTVPADDVTPAGEYKLTFSYAEKQAEVKVKVNQGTIDMTGVSWTEEAEFTYDGHQKFVILQNIPEGVSVSYENNEATDAGDYTAVATFVSADANYANPEVMTKPWVINKADLDISNVYITTGFSYDGTVKEARLDLSSLPAGVSATPVVENANRQTNAGPHQVEYSFTLSEDLAKNYNAISNKTYTFVINKGNISASQVTFNKTFIYNGDAQAPTVADFDFPAGVSASAIEVTAQENAGKYSATLTLAYEASALENYNNVTTLVVEWSINKNTFNTSTVAWSATKTFTYDGTPKSVTISGLPEGLEVSGYTNNTKTNAGSYTASAQFDYDTTNFEAPALSVSTCVWVINKAELTVTANNNTITFNDDPAYNNITITGFVNGETEATVRPTSGEVVLWSNYQKGKNVGSYTIYASDSGFIYDNYNVNYVTGTLTVNPLSVSVKDVSFKNVDFTYNGQVQKIELQGVPTGVKVAYEHKLNNTTIVASPIGAGTYTTTVTLSPMNANYVLTNTEIDGQSKSWQIKQVELTVKANDKETIFMQEAPTYDYEITGFVNGENATVIKGTAVFGSTYAVGSNVADYDITNSSSSLESRNYTFKYVKGTLTVKKATFDVSAASWSSASPYTYNGTHQAPTIVGIPTWVSSTVSYQKATEAVDETINVGEYVAIANVPSTANYDVTGTLENCEYAISAAKLTVAANNKEIKYYEAAPAYDYEITGFVNGETDSVVSGVVVFGCEYEVSDVVATYPITKTSGELSATNYVFEYKGAELIVSKATVDVSGVTWQYIDTYTYNGLTQSPTISEIVAPFEVDYNYLYNNDPDLEPINAGSYEVKVVFEENANYNISGTISKRQFIINKATVDETRIGWNVGEGEEYTSYYIKDYERVIEFYNESDVELEITWVSEDPTKNGPTEIGTYNYELNVAVVDTVNYNTLTKTTYKLKYIIKDVVKSVSATVYKSGNGDKADAQTVVYDGTAFVFENVVVTDIAVTFEDELPLNYAFYTSRALTTEVDIKNISSFEKGVIYYAIYVPINQDEYEIFDVRAINVQASYDIKLKVSDEVSTTYTLGVDTEAESVSLEPATYQILLNAYANENVAATVYNMPSYAGEYRADAIELSNEIVSVVVKIKFVVQEKTYIFEKQLTLVPSVDSDDYFTASFTITPDDGEAETNTATNNTLDVGADVTNIDNLSAESIDIELNEDVAETHEISSKEIVSYGGSYFLRVELAEKTSEAFTASPVKLYSTNEPVVVYIKLLVNGTFDSNTDAVISCEGSTVDYINHQITMYIDQMLVVETNNEFAKIELHADGQSQANIVRYGRLEHIFEETWPVTGCSLAIKATDGTYEYWTVVVKEREPESKNLMAVGTDMFGNVLNADATISTDEYYMGIEIDVTKTEAGEFIDTITLENWSSSKAFVLVPVVMDPMSNPVEVREINLYEIVEGADPVLVASGEDMYGEYMLLINFQNKGKYVAEITYDNGLATEIFITVSGKFGPFISTTYGGTTLSQTFDDNGEAKGDFVFLGKFEDMRGDDDISYYEGYLGEVEGVGDTLEISIDTEYLNNLYYSDGETKIADIKNPVELEVQTSGDGFKFVEFMLKQAKVKQVSTENGMVDVQYDVILKVQLYLCDKAERVYYHSFTFGDNTEEYDFRVSFDRLYDFGDITFELMMGGCYIELSREELDMAQNATTATLNITLSKTYKDYSYLFVTQEGAQAFDGIENPTVEDLKTFISQGLIFKADAEGKLSIPVEFVDGMSSIYVTVEGFDGTSFDEYSAVPLYIFIEGEFDWDQGGSGGGSQGGGYTEEIPNDIDFTISFKETDYTKEDFEFRNDVGFFVVDTNTTLADVVNNNQVPCEFTSFVYDDMTYSKVEIFSTQVNSEQFPAIYNMYIQPHQTNQYNYGYCGMVNITLYKDGEYYRSVQLLFTFSDSLTWNGNPGSGGGPSGPENDPYASSSKADITGHDFYNNLKTEDSMIFASADPDNGKPYETLTLVNWSKYDTLSIVAESNNADIMLTNAPTNWTNVWVGSKGRLNWNFGDNSFDFYLIIESSDKTSTNVIQLVFENYNSNPVFEASVGEEYNPDDTIYIDIDRASGSYYPHEYQNLGIDYSSDQTLAEDYLDVKYTVYFSSLADNALSTVTLSTLNSALINDMTYFNGTEYVAIEGLTFNVLSETVGSKTFNFIKFKIEGECTKTAVLPKFYSIEIKIVFALRADYIAEKTYPLTITIGDVSINTKLNKAEEYDSKDLYLNDYEDVYQIRVKKEDLTGYDETTGTISATAILSKTFTDMSYLILSENGISLFKVGQNYDDEILATPSIMAAESFTLKFVDCVAIFGILYEGATEVAYVKVIIEEPEVPTEYLPAGVNISVVIGQETLNDFDRHLSTGVGFYALSTQNLADLAQNEGKFVVADSISVDIELAEYDSFKLYDANGNELESTNVNLPVSTFEEGYCPEFRIRLYYDGDEEYDCEIILAIVFADSWELLNPEQ